MHYVSAEGLEKSYGIQPLFSGISFHIEQGDKIGLIAKNGSGKSTLLKILAGREQADAGKLWIHKEVTLAYVEQEPQFDDRLSLLDNLFRSGSPVIEAIKTYEDACDRNDEAAVQASVPYDPVTGFTPIAQLAKGPMILAVGPGRRAEASGELIPLDVKVGDTVVYSKYGGTEITVGGEDLLILSSRDVLAIVAK